MNNSSKAWLDTVQLSCNEVDRLFLDLAVVVNIIHERKTKLAVIKLNKLLSELEILITNLMVDYQRVIYTMRCLSKASASELKDVSRTVIVLTEVDKLISFLNDNPLDLDRLIAMSKDAAVAKQFIHNFPIVKSAILTDLGLIDKFMHGGSIAKIYDWANGANITSQSLDIPEAIGIIMDTAEERILSNEVDLPEMLCVRTIVNYVSFVHSLVRMCYQFVNI
jgi:hypothetical protein